MPRSRLEIYLLRHADAGDPETWRGDDAARPLSPKGISQAERLASFLAEMEFKPTAILSSPKLRARQTADVVGKRLKVTVTVDDRLSESFDIAALAAIAASAKGGDRARLVLVGHDPDFSAVASELTKAKGLQLAKCALARIDLDDQPAAGAGKLRWLIPPDALKPA